MSTQADLEAFIDKALATRVEGNEKFKNGDFKGALFCYHSVLLALKGIETRMQPFYGQMPAIDPPIVSKPIKDEDRIQEVKDDETVKNEKDEEGEGEKEPNKYDVVRKAVLNTYINSAAIHIKQNNFKRALECAHSAQKLDEMNPKAAFREAQARIGLGEISKGKAMLEELQRKQEDPAIAQTLRQLAKDQQEKESKKQAEFRGMFNRGKTTGKSDVTNESSTSHSEGGSSTNHDEKQEIDESQKGKKKKGSSEGSQSTLKDQMNDLNVSQ